MSADDRALKAKIQEGADVASSLVSHLMDTSNDAAYLSGVALALAVGAGSIAGRLPNEEARDRLSVKLSEVMTRATVAAHTGVPIVGEA